MVLLWFGIDHSWCVFVLVDRFVASAGGNLWKRTEMCHAPLGSRDRVGRQRVRQKKESNGLASQESDEN